VGEIKNPVSAIELTKIAHVLIKLFLKVCGQSMR